MNWTQIALLLLIFVLSSQIVISQDLPFYLNEMNTDPKIGSVYNNRIDSIWLAVQAGHIDSTNYLEAVDYLQQYFDQIENPITGDKAELFSCFILLKHKDYRSIVGRFESNLATYSHRAFTTINEIYRRAFISMSGNGLSGYALHLDSLSQVEQSENFQAFVTSVRDLKLGQKAPDFEINDLRGNYYSLDSLVGKVVLLDFWATWCVPCIAELP